MTTYFRLFILLFFCQFNTLFAQNLSSAATKWGDSFVEWDIFYDNDEEQGELRMRWIGNNDWTEWDYRIGDSMGSIKQKWRDNNNQWEVRGDGKVITIRRQYANDVNEWFITDNSLSFTIQTRFFNQADEWVLAENEFGTFYIYTYNEGDPRDWIIEDKLSKEIGIQIKMALFFIVMYNSCPKK